MCPHQPDVITLREAAGYNGTLGTLGYQKCHCKIKRKIIYVPAVLPLNYVIQNAKVHYHMKINNIHIH